MKLRLILLLFLLAVLVSGCVGQQKSEAETFTASDSALEISFLEGQPPDRIFGGNTFDVAVLAVNKGGTALPKDSIRFVLNDGKFGLTQQNAEQNAVRRNSEALAPISRVPSGEFLQGGRDVILWQDLSYNSVRPITEEVKTPIRADTCYKYNTISVVKLCVKTEKTTAVCKDDEAKAVENSGAPIKVSEFTELKSQKSQNGAEVGFKFKLKKVGDAKYKIYSPSAECGIINPEKLNNVQLDSMTFEGKTLLPYIICNDAIEAFLSSESLESDYIFCRFETDAASSYEGVLAMSFRYLITQSISKDMQIIPI